MLVDKLHILYPQFEWKKCDIISKNEYYMTIGSYFSCMFTWLCILCTPHVLLYLVLFMEIKILRKSVKNLQKCPIKIWSRFESTFQWAILYPKWSWQSKNMKVWSSRSLIFMSNCHIHAPKCFIIFVMVHQNRLKFKT
jgi:hypothetical protein